MISMNNKQVKKDCDKLRKLYGSKLKIEVRDGYYCCKFKGKFGEFYFLETYGKVGKPHCLSSDNYGRNKKIFKAIKYLMEI